MRSILLAAALASLPLTALATQPTKDTSAWWGHIKILASNANEGRLTGSPGYMKAAHYVAGKFKAAGLQPGGDAGTYFQSVKYLEEHVEAAHSSVALIDGGKTTPLTVGPDLTLGSRDAQPVTVEASASLTLKGATVDIQGSGPVNIKGAIINLG